MAFKFVTLRDRPEAAQHLGPLHTQFPRFVTDGDPINWHFWNEVGLYRHFPDYQFVLLNEDDKIIGCGHSIPLYWNGQAKDLPEGYDAALECGFNDLERKIQPNTLCALAAITDSNHKGEGLSYEVIQTMKAIAEKNGLSSLIAPVRPTWKQRYPLTSIDRYTAWKREDGAPLDPWLRVHWRLGGLQLKVAPKSMVVKGTVKEWMEWTGMAFPDSGQYVVPGALSTVNIDRDQNFGTYYDPNVWIQHKV